MKLIRLLVLNGLQFNRRVSVKYVKSADNILADSLSRQKWSTFWEYAPAGTRQIPDEVPDWLFPVEKFLIENWELDDICFLCRQQEFQRKKEVAFKQQFVDDFY